MVTEHEEMQNYLQKELETNRRLLSETNGIQDHIDQIRAFKKRKEKEWKAESRGLQNALKAATNSYQENEQEYQYHKYALRINFLDKQLG